MERGSLMTDLGTAARPLRVAIIGAGPGGILRRRASAAPQPSSSVDVDLFDRLPTPYGLVRAGRRARPPEDQVGHGGLRQDRRARALPLLRRRRARQARRRSPTCARTTTRSSTRPARRPTGAWAFPARTCRAATRRPSSSPGTTATPTTAICSSISRTSAWRSSGWATSPIDVARILLPHAGGAGEDRHRRARAGGAAGEPGAGGLSARPARRRRRRRSPIPRSRSSASCADARRRREARGSRAGRAEPCRRSRRAGDRRDLKKVEILQRIRAAARRAKPRRLVIRFLVSPVEP